MTRTPSRLVQITLSLAALLPVVSLISLLPQAAQADTKVRSSSFEYNPQGLLTKEVIEPASPNDERPLRPAGRSSPARLV